MRKGSIALETYVWDVRKFVHNLVSYPHINQIIDGYRQNQLIALPTETVYGLGANAKDEEAIKNIYKAKGRPSDNPLIVHIHNKNQLKDFTENISEETELLMDAFGQVQFHLSFHISQDI